MQAWTTAFEMLCNSIPQKSGTIWLTSYHLQGPQMNMEKCSQSVRNTPSQLPLPVVTFFTDPQWVFMRPRKMLALDKDVREKLAAALVTRYSPLQGQKIPFFVAKNCIPTGPVLQWGKIQITGGRDRMCCRVMIKPGSLGRDCTCVRVSPSGFHSSWFRSLLQSVH